MGEVGLPAETWDRSEDCPSCGTTMGEGEPGEKRQIFRSVAIANDWDPDSTLFVCADCEEDAIAAKQQDTARESDT